MFIHWQPALAVEPLVFLDEPRVSTIMARRHGRCARGLRLVNMIPHGHAPVCCRKVWHPAQGFANTRNACSMSVSVYGLGSSTASRPTSRCPTRTSPP